MVHWRIGLKRQVKGSGTAPFLIQTVERWGLDFAMLRNINRKVKNNLFV